MVAPPRRLKVNWPTEPNILVAIPCRYAIVLGVSREPRFLCFPGRPTETSGQDWRPSRPPLKGGDVLGGRGFVLDVSIGDWKEPFIRMPSLFELLPFTCFPWIVSLISVRLPLAVFLGPSSSLGLRRLFVRFLSIVRPEGLLSGERSISKRENDGDLTGKRRRMRTVRWALACLPMRSPSLSFWRYKGTEKISYHKTFRPKNAAKIENYFGQN